jgi:hypothetical protein
MDQGKVYTSNNYPQDFLRRLAGTPPSDYLCRPKIPLPREKIQLEKSYVELMSWALNTAPIEDQLFISPTFHFEVSPFKVEREVRICMARLSEALRGKTGSKLRWISVIEKQKRGVYHPHILAIGEGLGKLSRRRIKQRIRKQFGSKQARVLPVKEGLPFYMAKRIPFGAEVSFGGYWPPTLRFEP